MVDGKYFTFVIPIIDKLERRRLFTSNSDLIQASCGACVEDDIVVGREGVGSVEEDPAGEGAIGGG